ncbi:MAG TPA: RNA methyltransferase, partial [Geobacteraceae bacterium]
MTITSPPGANVSIALLHHPVYDKNRQVVTTAVTNLDIHDIARSARTYGLHRYYVVTPVAEQQEMVERIRRHWLEGWGATYNPKRREALELIRLADGLEAVLLELATEFGREAKVVLTGAQGRS